MQLNRNIFQCLILRPFSVFSCVSNNFGSVLGCHLIFSVKFVQYFEAKSIEKLWTSQLYNLACLCDQTNKTNNFWMSFLTLLWVIAQICFYYCSYWRNHSTSTTVPMTSIQKRSDVVRTFSGCKVCWSKSALTAQLTVKSFLQTSQPHFFQAYVRVCLTLVKCWYLYYPDVMVSGAWTEH